MASTIDVYLEIGNKRTFAGAIDWPGWCRRGRDEDSALRALLDAAPRYALALRWTRLGFAAPADGSALRVAERLEGDATTDFGAPGQAPTADAAPFGDAELGRSRTILAACWRAFDATVGSATGVELGTGSRGGGRTLESIVDHVIDADASYLPRLAWKPRKGDRALEGTRRAVLDALDSAVANGLPERGPRGGAIWTPRYFVRRAAWHVLDHTWEIEDRTARS